MLSTVRAEITMGKACENSSWAMIISRADCIGPILIYKPMVMFDPLGGGGGAPDLQYSYN